MLHMNTKWAADMIYLGKKSVCHNSFQSLELPWESKINFFFVFVVTSDILEKDHWGTWRSENSVLPTFSCKHMVAL